MLGGDMNPFTKETGSLLSFCLVDSWDILNTSAQFNTDTQFSDIWKTLEVKDASLRLPCPLPSNILCQVLVCLGILVKRQRNEKLLIHCIKILFFSLHRQLDYSKILLKDDLNESVSYASIRELVHYLLYPADLERGILAFSRRRIIDLLHTLTWFFFFSDTSRDECHEGRQEFRQSLKEALMERRKTVEYFQLFCGILHRILSFYHVNDSSEEMAKTTFLLEEKAKLYQSFPDKHTRLRPIGNVIVTRNELSGKVECLPYSNLTLKEISRNSISRTPKVSEPPTETRTTEEFLESKRKQHLVAQRIAHGLLFILNSASAPHHRGPNSLENWNVDMAGYAIPLILRLINIQDVKCQIQGLCCLDRVVKWTSPQVIAQFYVPISTTLQRNYPVFLDLTVHQNHLRKIKMYLKVFFNLVSLAYPTPMDSLTFPCMTFLLNRIHLNMIHWTNRLCIVLNSLHRLVKRSPYLFILHGQTLFHISIQAMENSASHVNLFAVHLVAHLVKELPRFCTERYWKDICVRLCLLRERFCSKRVQETEANRSTTQVFKRLGYALESLISTMTKRAQEPTILNVIKTSPVQKEVLMVNSLKKTQQV